MVTTRNTVEDPNGVIRALELRMEEMQRRHEEMQKKHEEEMAAVRAECLAQMREQTTQANGEKERTKPLEDEGEGHSNVRKNENNKDGGEKGESAILIKDETPSVPVPFARAIMEVQIPDRFIPPQFKTYNGTSDPEAHVKSFTNAMAFRTGCDAIWCRAFSLSLEGEALEWFDSLPDGSIENFKGLSNMFKNQFAACRTQEATIVDLMNLKQGKEEPLKDFMDRFQKTVRRVKGLSTELALQHVMPGLRPGPFKDSVCRNPPRSMEELRQRTADEIRVEDMKQSYRNELQEAKAEKESRRDNQGGRSGGNKTRDGPRNPRFPQYTQLNAPRARILQESLSTHVMQVPQQRPTPPGADNSKHCLYHQNMGHNTEDCVTLKDKIEEMIRAGLLQQYVKGHRPAEDRAEGEKRGYVRQSYPRGGEKRAYTRSPPRSERNHRSSDCYNEWYAGNRRDEGRRSRSRSQDRARNRPLRGVINTISGGFAGGGQSSSARKRSIRTLRSIHAVEVPKRTMLPITFTDEDFHAPDPEQDDPMVITVEIARYEVSKVLVDQGSSVNILYWKTFQQMDISEDLIVPFGEQLVGFAGERVDTRGYLDLRIRLGTSRSSEERKVRFLLVEANTSYNALLGRPCLNTFGAIVSTPT
ncbi:uncharacterized protein LOC106770532 [Vigna radiata var. radiata]|uniref:Uncharacterized protein LOC106770532 n=1 Tax=Vigna radiata var. radiata TaxID=3916 RepID=A0A1S3V0W2_VIGRR|nr:uncharacterized protein LOC106770532 [Vigna radiata var. radiata]